MFPKFLRLSAYSVEKESVPVNETHSAEEIFLYNSDQSVLDLYASALGFTYEVVLPPEDGKIDIRLRNGSWTGLLGMLQRGEIDMIVGDCTIRQKMYEDFRVSYPNDIYGITFVTKKHEHVPDPTLFLQPFSIPVWFSISACTFLVSFLLYYLLRRKHSAINLFTSTVGCLVGQAIGITPQRCRDYIVLGSWLVSSAFLCYFYGAVLLSFLTFPSMQGIRTIQDLADGITDGKYECATYPNTIYGWFFRNSRIPAFRVIGKNLFGASDYSFDYLETSVGQKKRAFVGTRRNLDSYKNFYFISEENFFFLTSGYVVRKDFCCGSEVDKVTHRFWASGIFQSFSRRLSDWFFFQFLETEYWKIPPAEGKLTLTQLKGPFILLIVCHSLAFLVFLIEVFIGKLKKN